MQRKFGGDRRFELDSRFLESEDEEVSNRRDNVGNENEESVNSDAKHWLSERYTGTVSIQKKDEISRSLAEEKEIAMKVLSNILGGDFRADYGSQEKKMPEFRY